MADERAKKGLTQVVPGAEGLGRPTIMDRALAQRHGAAYVHVAVFAIDVDRVRDAREALEDDLPFAWEVFLTEAYLVERLDPEADPDARALVEDLVLGVIDRSAESAGGEEGVLGSQLPFAAWDAIARGAWPDSLRGAFDAWKARPTKLVKDLARLWAEKDVRVRALARACLETPMTPPLAPPTLEALARMAGDPPPAG